MPYTDDPENVPADEVRFLLGDTGSAPQLTDNEVAYLLAEQGTAERAAARGAEILAAKYSHEADVKTVGPLRLEYTERAARFQALAGSLWGSTATRSVVPYAGGISATDKEARAGDSDRVRPAFTRRMMQYPNTDTRPSRDQLLSPPPELP